MRAVLEKNSCNMAERVAMFDLENLTPKAFLEMPDEFEVADCMQCKPLCSCRRQLTAGLRRPTPGLHPSIPGLRRAAPGLRARWGGTVRRMRPCRLLRQQAAMTEDRQEFNIRGASQALVAMLEDVDEADCKHRGDPLEATPPPTSYSPSYSGSSTGYPASSPTNSGSSSGDTGSEGTSEWEAYLRISPRSFAEASGGRGSKSPPAAEMLPRPAFAGSSDRWSQQLLDVGSWVQASTPNPDRSGSEPSDLTYSWPPAPVTLTDNVKHFFEPFKIRMCTVGDKTCVRNRVLMQQLKDWFDRQSVYR